MISSQMNKEKFIQIPKMINLKMNFEGLSDSMIPKCDNKNLNA